MVAPLAEDATAANPVDTKAAEEERAEVRSNLNIALASWISRRAELGIGT